MKGLIVTSKGLEETARIDVKELINADCKIEEGCAIFDFEDFEDLCLLCYKCQSADRVLYLIGSFEFRDFFQDFEEFIGKISFDEWLSTHKQFKIECIRLGTHDFKSVDVESKAANLLIKKSKDKIKVDKKGYEIIFFVYVFGSRCYFGIDFAGFELNKRGYKIYLHPSSLRGTIAYALVRESGFGKTDVMLDPFSRDGIIPIESAFYACGFPYNYYKKDKFAFLKLKLGIDFDKFFKNTDKKIGKSRAKIYSFDHLFKYVNYSRKNAKIAGVDKEISFSRTELESLDVKFKEKTIDGIIANPPTSKNADLDKIYNEFFYQSAYILKDNGSIAIISRIPDFVKKHAAKHNFVVAKEKDLWSGEQLLSILIFKKKTI
ncbi:methyltransferase [Candidatus Woesearchaeota archaeon]|nr:methyltransferase [Candidatus Woesearchaeota archaeon]